MTPQTCTDSHRHLNVFDVYPQEEIWLQAANRIREGNGTPFQYSCLENPMDRGAWQAAVNGVLKSRTRLSDFTFTFHFHALEKEMETHSSVLAWRIPGTEEPVDCHLWDHTESDTTEVTQQQQQPGYSVYPIPMLCSMLLSPIIFSIPFCFT